MDRLEKFHTKDLLTRAAAAITTRLVEQACDLQNASPLASMAMGRALTGALLMASMQSEKQKVGVRFSGDGPLGELFVEATYEGTCRGYCQNPQADVPLKNGRLDVAAGIGKGTLSVLRSLPHQHQPHQGIVPIHSGEIGEDLAFYLHQSHQIPSIVSLSVTLNPDASIEAAGGVLVELLPGATEDVVQKLEKRAAEAPALSSLLRSESGCKALALNYSHQPDLVEIPHAPNPRFYCPCSVERVERTLHLLGRAALAEMVLKSEPIEVRCEFCAKQYQVLPDRIRTLLEEIPPQTPAN